MSKKNKKPTEDTLAQIYHTCRDQMERDNDTKNWFYPIAVSRSSKLREVKEPLKNPTFRRLESGTPLSHQSFKAKDKRCRIK